MINDRQPRDIPQVLLSVLFLSLIIVSCLWVVQPFILSFAWAGTVVIATWPVLLRLQRLLLGKRALAVLVMTVLLFLLFVIPIALPKGQLIRFRAQSTYASHAAVQCNLSAAYDVPSPMTGSAESCARS